MVLQINSFSGCYELRRFGEDEKCRAEGHSLSLSPKMATWATLPVHDQKYLLCITAPSEEPPPPTQHSLQFSTVSILYIS